jgi:hypothetical protein
MWWHTPRNLISSFGEADESPFKSEEASVQSTTGSRGVRISGSDAGYTVFRGNVKGTGYPLHWPVSPLLPTLLHHVSSRFNWTITRALNTLRTGDADLSFYITTVQDGWRKSAFLTRAYFPCTIHLIVQYIEPVSEWSCWRMFIETWPQSELNFRHRASSI